MQAHVAVAHLALDFALGGEGRYRVDNDYVDSRRADKLLYDFEGLFAVVGLRYEQVVDVDTEFFGIEAVEGVLGIDDCRDAAELLGLGYGVYCECGLTR